jgi:hypothetical protein
LAPPVKLAGANFTGRGRYDTPCRRPFLRA